jgi:MFS family permease
MVNDARRPHRNSACAGGHQRSSTPDAGGRDHVAAHFRALRHRNYRLFFWGQLVSLIGTWMQQTAMSWFVYEITNSKFLLGLVSAIGSAPMAFSSIWGGSLADLYPKRSILIATQSSQMACAFLLAAGVWLGFASALFIVIVAALNGLAMGFDMPARQAFTVEMASRENLLNAISLNSSIVNGARASLARQ